VVDGIEAEQRPEGGRQDARRGVFADVVALVLLLTGVACLVMGAWMLLPAAGVLASGALSVVSGVLLLRVGAPR
jgi:hypothetical protein